MTVLKDRVALKENAVPCIFPNCPPYLTDHNIKTKRLSKEDKEQLRMEEAFSKSLADNEETVVN